MKPPRFQFPLLRGFTRRCFLAAITTAVLRASAADAIPVSETSVRAVGELETWLREPREKRAKIGDAAFSRVALTKADAERARAMLWEDHAAFIRDTRHAEMEEGVISLGGLRMKYETVDFGPKETVPPGGRSLFLSLHGGGGAPPQVNESQWRNQVKLAKGYAPAEGIYLAPRAPTDTWDLWHQSHIDNFFDRLIENLIVFRNVNPNRVYVFGYSAGGDGVYQLGPRMADRWAAAAMMAGHPNEASPLGLRNIGFAIQVGANDGGYNRNKVAEEWGRQLDALAAADPGGYPHFTELHAGKAHWMDLEDRKAIPWMEKFTRNPLPEKIVWHQDDVVHSRFYWLALPKDGAHAGQDITAGRSGQAITLTAKGAATVIVRVNDAMLDLDRPVTISIAGKAMFSGRIPRTIGALAATLDERGDPDLVFSGEVAVGE
jgi:poly(3-hydroxybutyrate) depolymerase